MVIDYENRSKMLLFMLDVGRIEKLSSQIRNLP